LHHELLPFTISVAETQEELLSACAVRAAAYGRRFEPLRSLFRLPDAIDALPGTLVVLATDKDSGRPVGTARVSTSAFAPLPIQHCAELPQSLDGRHLAEITRLAVDPAGSNRLVRQALWKTVYLLCVSQQVHQMVIGARNAALIRSYKSLGFEDVSPGGRPVALDYAGGLEHHVLCFDVPSIERVWLERRHSLYRWFFETHHPDIRIVAGGLRSHERWSLSSSILGRNSPSTVRSAGTEPPASMVA